MAVRTASQMTRLRAACRTIAWALAALFEAHAFATAMVSTIPNEMIQMIQAGSTVEVERIVESKKEGNKIVLKGISWGNDIDGEKKAALVKFLTDPENLSASASKVATPYYMITIVDKAHMFTVICGKEGLTISDGKRVLLQQGFSEPGLQKFLAWAVAAAKPPNDSQFVPMPSYLSDRQIELNPTDNLMKTLLNDHAAESLPASSP